MPRHLPVSILILLFSEYIALRITLPDSVASEHSSLLGAAAAMNHDEGEKDDVGSLTGEEVAKHNSRESCWVIVNGKAYDVTEFLPGPHCLAYATLPS